MLSDSIKIAVTVQVSKQCDDRSGDYKLDKPLVVAEFMEKDNSGAGMNDAQMFTYVHSHGYAGAWVWSDDTESAQAAGIRALKGQPDVVAGTV
nr:hypothetical protein BaRGS_003344 [Batillaria attramentaria]KAG5687815.1 hypothetical protein BaRGS_005445 [Batillaria attramentaria]